LQREIIYKIWKEKYVLPDFISVAFYAYERGADGQDIHAKRSTDDDLFRHLLKMEKKLLEKSGLGNIPIYVSEWNYTPSVRNYINDTCYKGAYILKNIIDIHSEVKSMCFGAGSDRQYSSYDTTDFLFGGTGLISKEGALKPAAFALSFANSMYNRCVGTDDHYLITTDGYNNYAIICHNQQKLNDNYFLTPETQVQKDAIWKYFDRMYRLKLQIHLKDMKDGLYRVKIYRVNNQNGSVLDVWNSMDCENDLSLNDVAYIKQMSQPVKVIRKTETVMGSLLIQEELAANEIALIKIYYISQ